MRSISLWPLLFFSLLAVSLLAPLAPKDFLPGYNTDSENHLVSVISAKAALDEGQFPIRVMPTFNDNFRYPVYQFYSPLSYGLAGAVYKWIVPKNPYEAMKIIFWLALTFAGIYWYRLVVLLFDSPMVGLLAGFVYISAPYLLINLFARMDFTEVVAQCVVPIALYYSFRIYLEKFSPTILLLTAISWFALLTTHILTYVWGSFFIGAMFLILTFCRYASWKKLWTLGFAYLSGVILGLWYLAPITFTHVLNIYDAFFDPYVYGWVNPLPTLLSIAAVSPMPFPGNHQLSIALYPAVGWLMLLAVGIALFKLITASKKMLPQERNFLLVALFLFLMAFFLIWTPIDIYRIIPKFLYMQFSYRLLTQVMWLGTLIFAAVFIMLFGKKFHQGYFLFFLLLIGLSCKSWFPTEDYGISQPWILSHPLVFTYGQNDYLVNPKKISNLQTNFLQVDVVKKNCHQEKYKTICMINNSLQNQQWAQLPIFYYPDLLNVSLNGQTVAYAPTLHNKNSVLTAVPLKPGQNTVSVYFRGLGWANWLSAIAWVICILFFCIESFGKLVIFFKRLRYKTT